MLEAPRKPSWVAASMSRQPQTKRLTTSCHPSHRIVERWEGMVRDNAVENLEACLMLTQSSCKVPNPLIPETKREDHQPFAISSARRRAKEVSTTCGTNHA